MLILRRVLLISAVVIATGGGVRAAEAPVKPEKPQIGTRMSASDLQKLIQQFNSRRDTLLASRQALLNQLKTATTEQRKEILQKMEAQQKDLLDAQRALGKQIRDDMRKLRQSLPGPGRR